MSASSFAGCEAMESSGVDIEGVNQAASTARHIILLGGILLGEGNKDHAVQVLHVERSVSCRSPLVPELPKQLRIAIIDVERAFMKIRRQQHSVCSKGRERDSLIDRVGPGRQHFSGGSKVGSPAGDRPIFAYE